MREDFVSYDIAVKLKEKGYPQVKKDSLAMYNQDGDWFSLASNLDTFEYLFEDFDDRDCVCPTIFQVLKWMREENNVVVSMYPYYGKDVNTHWCWDVRMPVHRIDVCNHIKQDSFNSYEQAALAGIEYVIDNLI